MDTLELFCILWLVVVIFFGVYFICKNIWSLFDHIKWDKDSRPSYDAKIINITSDEVRYLKGHAKYKTVIYFSDGFVFTTHKTNREEGFLSYRISIDGNLSREFVKKAIKLHEKAVRKKIDNTKVKKTSDYVFSKKEPINDPFEVYYKNGEKHNNSK